MIPKFEKDTALLLVDVQVGVDVLSHWGGPTGRRNNPDAETTMLDLLHAWRDTGNPVAFTRHDSVEIDSPLKLNLPSGEQKKGFEILSGEIAVQKHTNSGFIGTSLQSDFATRGVTRLVVAGFFTNFCVETTVRMAGNLGYDTYLVTEGCATTNRVGPNGADYDPELMHDIAVANLHGEFCTAIGAQDARELLRQDAEGLSRAQGNE